MYCHACGIHNTDDQQHCRICKADLTEGKVPENNIVYADLMHFPLIPLLSHTLRSTSPLLWILIAPIFSLLYLFRKLTGTPFLSPLMNRHAPKLHVTTIEGGQNLHKASFQKASSFFEQEGFEPLIDLDDVSMAQGVLLHIRYHRDRKVFGIAHISKASGKTSYVTFLAFIPKKTMLSVDNTHALPIQFPQNLKVLHFPGMPIQKSFQQFLDALKKCSREPAALSLASFLRNQYTLRQYSVKLGLQQQLLRHKGEGAGHASFVSACYFHPSNVAVRKCTTCGTALCELCYTEHDDRYFCQKCLPPEEISRVFTLHMPEGFHYAGFGIRTVAALIDVILVVAFLAMVFWGISFETRLFPGSNNGNLFPFLVTQFVAVATITWYLMAPVRKFGATLGQKIVGLRIIDKDGKSPETAATIVRFAYHLVAGLFIFPLLGYFFIVFKKNKQGLHDRLAGTFVITKRPLVKATLSWGLLCVLLAGGMGQAYQYRAFFSWMPPLFASMNSYQANIELDAHWIQEVTDEDSAIISYVNRGEHCIVSTVKSVYAVEMRTGNTVWVNNEVPGLSLQPVSNDTAYPLLGTQYSSDQDRVFFSRLDSETGKLLWQIPFNGDYPGVSYDAQLIVTYEKMTVTGFDVAGNQLWTRHFDDQSIIDYVAFHSGVLLGRYSEDSVTLTYLDRKTGRTIWEEKDAAYSPGFVLKQDQQIFYTEDGKSVLMNVHKYLPLWDTPLSIGRALTLETDPDSGTTYLYTTMAAIDPKDGSSFFVYPPGSRFGENTPDFLLLFQESSARQNTIVLLDKFTGEIKRTLDRKFWFAATYLAEDPTYIYLTATLKPLKTGDITIRSQLLRFQRDTLNITEIPIGYNLSSLHAELFSEEGLLFIPSYQHLGGYVLPEM